MPRKQPLKPGEKLLFIVFGAFFVFAVMGFVVMETMRNRSVDPMFVSRSSFELSEEGLRGSRLFRKANCTACHRAMRNGTNSGLSLDGIGSYRDVAWLESFLRRPEDVYDAQRVDHGPGKEAGYVSTMPAQDLHSIAVFLSELKAEQGSSMARVPPPEQSGFVDSMVNTWAPDEWKGKYRDIREKVGEYEDSGGGERQSP